MIEIIIFDYFKEVYVSPILKKKLYLSDTWSKLNNEIIFIGDSDKEAANQNNLPFVAVLSGMGMESEKYKIGDLNGLIPLIDSFKHSP